MPLPPRPSGRFPPASLGYTAQVVGRFSISIPALLVVLGLPALAAQEPTSPPAPETAGAAPLVCQVTFKEAVQPISAEFLIGAVAEAEESGAALLLVKVDTPGGLVSSMEEILDALIASEVPVVYWIAPTGAMAASAGFLMSLAADVVAAAPGTTLGAASVITIGGEGSEDGGQKSTALKKMGEILAARARSMAQARGRDPDLVDKAVFEAKAWSAEEALEVGLVDLIAAERDELMRELDGRTITRSDGEEQTLALEGYRVEEITMSWRQQALNLLANPNISYILLLIGVFGVLMELYNPGVIIPGVIGGVSLLLFGFSIKILPISAIGVILVVLAVGFFIAEVKVTSYGLLTVGGILCLVLGGLMLIGDEAPDIPAFHVDPGLVIGVAVTFGLLTAWGLFLVMKAHQSKVTTGREGLIGEMGVAATDLEPRGKVRVHGEFWKAESTSPVRQGTEVRVVAVRGLQVEVEPASDLPNANLSTELGG